MLTAFLVGMGVGAIGGATIMAMLQIAARADREAIDAFRRRPR